MDNEIINKLCRFSFIMAIIGVCTLGICPAFSMMGLAVPIVFNTKGVRLNDDLKKKSKTAIILSVIGLVLFVLDLVFALYFTK